MALSDLTRRVITRFEAVTDGLEAGAAKVNDAVSKVGSGAVSMGEGFAEGVKSGTEALAKLNLAMDGINKVVDFAKESFKVYADDLRLQAAAGAADIEKLSEATNGLANEHELLTFAAKAQHGMFQLNQEQMETVEQAMLRLTRAGFDQQDVTDKLTNAVVSLKTKGLDKLGIAVKDGTTDTEKFNNIMDALAKKANASDTATASAGESVQKMGVQWHDALEMLKKSIGELIVSLQPLLEMMATAIEYGAKSKQYIPGGGSGLTGAPAFLGNKGAEALRNLQISQSQKQTDSLLANLDADNRPTDEDAAASGFGSFVASANGALNQLVTADPWSQTADVIGAHLTAAKKKYDTALERAKAMNEARKKLSDEVAKSTTDDLVKQLGDQVDTSVSGSLGGYSAVMNQGMGVSSDITSTMLVASRVQQQAAGYKAYNDKQTKSFLEGMFGKLEEFNAYKEAFGMISGAATTAFNAMVDGNQSAGEAVKHFIADQLKALGGRMLVRGLEEVAEGIASLASYQYPAAAAHFESAAAFGAGAAIAGIAANSIGTSASAASSAGSASASAPSAGTGGASSSSSSGTGPPPAIIVYGDSFSDGDFRSRQIKAKKMVALALGSTTGMRTTR